MNIQLTQFEKLKEAIQKYGVLDFSKQIEIKEEIKRFEEGEGLDIDLSDVFSTDNKELFTILKDGSIRKTIIHIVDISSRRDNWGYPKFHIYFCGTIEEMQNKGRKHRYRVSGRKDGQFYLIKKYKEGYETLDICSHCLKLYNNQFTSDKRKQNFSVKEYIEQPTIHSEFSDIELDLCSVPNSYVKEWPKISKYMKKRSEYICSSCGRDFSKFKSFLHTHHIDANKRNNTRENLKVLCIECHSKEYNHGHIKQTPRYKEYLKVKNKIS